MRRMARVTIAAALVATAFAAPAAESGAASLDEAVRKAGCTSGHDGPRCGDPVDRVRGVRVTLPQPRVGTCRRGSASNACYARTRR